MGDGTSFGVQTPSQPGVILREGENFPVIPAELLELSLGQLQQRIDRLAKSREANQNRFILDFDHQERLEYSQALHEFAKVAVERKLTVTREKGL